MEGKMKHDSKIEKPGVEVIVYAGDSELAVIAFFEDGDGGWDVVVGISDTKERNNLQAVLKHAADSMGAAAFRPTRTIDHAGDDYAPPF